MTTVFVEQPLAFRGFANKWGHHFVYWKSQHGSLVLYSKKPSYGKNLDVERTLFWRTFRYWNLRLWNSLDSVHLKPFCWSGTLWQPAFLWIDHGLWSIGPCFFSSWTLSASLGGSSNQLGNPNEPPWKSSLDEVKPGEQKLFSASTADSQSSLLL